MTSGGSNSSVPVNGNTSLLTICGSNTSLLTSGNNSDTTLVCDDVGPAVTQVASTDAGTAPKRKRGRPAKSRTTGGNLAPVAAGNEESVSKKNEISPKDKKEEDGERSGPEVDAGIELREKKSRATAWPLQPEVKMTPSPEARSGCRCPVCYAAFGSKALLRQHMNELHSIPFNVNIFS
jgi:hypothetical protein